MKAELKVDGMTETLCGQCVPKDSTVCDICGEIDWIQAKIDKVLFYLPFSTDNIEHARQLNIIYNTLGQMSAEVSNSKIDEKIRNFIDNRSVLELNKWIVSMNVVVKGFQRFDKILSIEVNELRIAIRKFERTLTKYLREKTIRKEVYEYVNRLSYYFFILSVRLQRGEIHGRL